MGAVSSAVTLPQAVGIVLKGLGLGGSIVCDHLWGQGGRPSKTLDAVLWLPLLCLYSGKPDLRPTMA